MDADPIVLIGGDSRAARAITDRFPNRSITSVVRRNPGKNRVVVTDYAEPPAGLIAAGSVVINCVGTPVGDAAALARINVDVPLRWAVAARSAGARLFIQLSSLSVYGASTLIDTDTPVRPATAYGRSKSEAERVLRDVSGDAFPVAILRIPILIGTRGTDKLHSLISVCRRLHVVPVTTPAVQRSMLSYDGLAACVALIAGSMSTNRVVVLADPEAFSYEMIRVAAQAHGVRMTSMRIPAPFVAGLSRIVPAMTQRLFTSSLVRDEVNFARHALPFERLGAIVDMAIADVRSKTDGIFDASRS